MRISTSNSYNTGLDTLVARQAGLAGVQEQMTTGKRVNHASDDPAAAARAERALGAERRSLANQRGVDASANAMVLTEGALADAGSLLQQVREALVAAGNATYSDTERSVVAGQIADLRTQLLAVANRSDGAGAYLFGGQGASAPPFVDAAGGVRFEGVAGELQAASGEALPLTTNGEAAWMTARTGNGVFETRATVSTGTAVIDGGQVANPAAVTGASYRVQFSVSAGSTTYSVLKDGAATAQTNLAFTPGQRVAVDGLAATITGQPASGDTFDLVPSSASLSVFDVLDRAVAGLKTPGRSGTQIAQGTVENLNHLDAVLGGVLAARGRVGATLNRIDAVADRLEAQNLASRTERSNAEDADMTQVISDFSNRQTGYEAALKAYSMVQRLSLFNYLNG